MRVDNAAQPFSTEQAVIEALVGLPRHQDAAAGPLVIHILLP